VRFSSNIEEIQLEAESIAVQPQQMALLQARPKRDLAAAARALARVRAMFGAASVTRAQLQGACLPEARYRWEPVAELRVPQPTTPAQGRSLVRRLFVSPQPLPSPTQRGAWLGEYGTIQSIHGPGRISGGWWLQRVERDYYWIETHAGEILWIYHDRPRRRWLLHGILD
jgi:protein ImuB